MRTNILFVATFYIITNWTDVRVIPDPSCPSNAIPNRFIITQQMTVSSNVIYAATHKDQYIRFNDLFPIQLTNAPTRQTTNTVENNLWYSQLLTNTPPVGIQNVKYTP